MGLFMPGPVVQGGLLFVTLLTIPKSVLVREGGSRHTVLTIRDETGQHCWHERNVDVAPVAVVCQRCGPRCTVDRSSPRRVVVGGLARAGTTHQHQHSAELDLDTADSPDNYVLVVAVVQP